MAKEQPIRFPTQVTPRMRFFDRMAETIHRFVSSAVYFVVSFLIIVLALGAAGSSGFQEIWLWTISLTTAVVTFLMVALLENVARRNDLALHHKLNAHSRALLELLSTKGSDAVRRELVASIGVEERESAAGPTE